MRTRRDSTRRRYRNEGDSVPAGGMHGRAPSGAAGIRIRLNVQGWIRKLARVQAAVANSGKIRLGYAGNHSVLNQTNKRIAEHAIAHGDKIWTFSDGTLGEMSAYLRDGVIKLARTPRARDLKPVMQELCDMAREDIYMNILDGKIEGPARTAEWNAYKAAKWGGQTPNMVASRQWLDSLTAELVSR